MKENASLIYSIANLQGLFNVCKNWTFKFKIDLPNYLSGKGDGFSFHGPSFKSAG